MSCNEAQGKPQTSFQEKDVDCFNFINIDENVLRILVIRISSVISFLFCCNKICDLF